MPPRTTTAHAGARACRRGVAAVALGLVVAGGATAAASAATAAPTGPATQLQSKYEKVVRQVRPSVVQITTSSGLGSGIVFDHKGDIVTNDHVVGSAHQVTVQFVSGDEAKGTVRGTFPGDDLAVVRVKGVPANKLRSARFANSSKLQVGEIVLAIGNPLAYESSVTQGIVSATGRTVVEPLTSDSPGGVIANAIQTSAPINPGNSGGALVDLDGRVTGIPTLAAQDPQIGGAAVGIGFAIPANTVTDIAKQIIAHGHVVNSHRADLGIYSYQATSGTGAPTGVAIAKAMAHGPAARAGLSRGDVIVGLAGKHVSTLQGLETILVSLKPGQRVSLTYLKPDGTRASTKVTLGTLPATG